MPLFGVSSNLHTYPPPPNHNIPDKSDATQCEHAVSVTRFYNYKLKSIKVDWIDKRLVLIPSFIFDIDIY